MEHLTVLEGALEVQSGAETVAVTAGGTARYPVDVHHAIRNQAGEVARALLVVVN
jgi:quercetin dioxygenase-like cupin family protein